MAAVVAADLMTSLVVRQGFEAAAACAEVAEEETQRTAPPPNHLAPLALNEA